MPGFCWHGSWRSLVPELVLGSEYHYWVAWLHFGLQQEPLHALLLRFNHGGWVPSAIASQEVAEVGFGTSLTGMMDVSWCSSFNVTITLNAHQKLNWKALKSWNPVIFASAISCTSSMLLEKRVLTCIPSFFPAPIFCENHMGVIGVHSHNAIIKEWVSERATLTGSFFSFVWILWLQSCWTPKCFAILLGDFWALE